MQAGLGAAATGADRRLGGLLGLIAWAWICTGLGCASDPVGLSVTGSAATPASVPDAGAGVAADLDRMSRVLRGMGFRIARRDHRAGVLTTVPRSSPLLVEFWRADAVPGHRRASTLGHLRRVVRVVFPGNGGAPEVRALLERRDRPARRVVVGSRGRVFDDTSTVVVPDVETVGAAAVASPGAVEDAEAQASASVSTPGPGPGPEAAAGWVATGRDAALEAAVLARYRSAG